MPSNGEEVEGLRQEYFRVVNELLELTGPLKNDDMEIVRILADRRCDEPLCRLARICHDLWDLGVQPPILREAIVTAPIESIGQIAYEN